jgi:expansin
MQVLDSNYPVTALDVSTDGAQTWQSTVRREYNYFEKEKAGGFDKDTLFVRVSCSNGRQVIIPNVSQASEAKTVAPVNC